MCFKSTLQRGSDCSSSATAALRTTTKETCFSQKASTLKPGVYPWKNNMCSYLPLEKLAQRLPWKQEASECIEKTHSAIWTDDSFLSWEIRKSWNHFVKIFMLAIIVNKLSCGFWIADLISGGQNRNLSFPSEDNMLPRKSSCALKFRWNFLQLLLVL